jgi:predicted O-methyltransferase YrrM
MLENLEDLPGLLQKLRGGADAAVRAERLLRQLVQLELARQLASQPRFQDPKRLLASAFKVYSQGPEDGMIAEVFRRIGLGARRFVEFGVESGLECNSAFLLVQGWSGAWIEGSSRHAGKAHRNFKGYPVEVVNDFVTVENADALIARLAGEDELDLLSIDIDFNDYWVWRAITTVRPRLLVIEYNATLPPDLRKTVPYAAQGGWTGSNYFGASLGALEALGLEKGYSLVGCSPSGVNAFFVRDDLVGDRFCAPFTAVNHYEPPRYGLVGPSGHSPGMGPWIDV